MITLFWLAACLAALGPASEFVTPATVIRTETAFATDFEPGRGLAGLGPAADGVALVPDGTGTCLRLAPPPRRDLCVWLPLPDRASGKQLQIKLRARAEAGDGPAELRLAPVYGTRPPASAPHWARAVLHPGDAWSEIALPSCLATPADRLALQVPAGGRAIEVDDLSVEVRTTVRDETLARVAARTGNLIVNGGFEAGAAGFTAVYVHNSLGPDDPPVPSGLRTSERDANEGKQAAFGLVGPATLVVCAEPVVLRPDQSYTFAVTARALSPSGARLALELRTGDGTELGRKEAALGFDWRRIHTTFKTPGPAALVWIPRIVVYPGEQTFPLQLDAISLTEGDKPDYTPPTSAVLDLEDGLTGFAGLGPGHIAEPGTPVKITARFMLGAPAEGPVALRAVLESRLGADQRALPEAQIQAEPGVPTEVTVLDEPLPAGWYRLRVEARNGEQLLARRELILAALRQPAEADGWDLAVDWTTPDGLLPGPARTAVLGRLGLLGITTRWLRDNAVAWWGAHEPQPGAVEIGPLRQAVEAGNESKLATVLELDPFPLAERAPAWLARTLSPDAAGRLAPSPEIWKRYLDGLIRSLGQLRPTLALSDPPAGCETAAAARLAALQQALGASSSSWAVVPSIETAWQRLPALPSGPLESTVLEPQETIEIAGPLDLERQRVAALLEGIAGGRRAFLLPCQGYQPVGDGRWRHPGLTTADNGPRPLVSIWATIRAAAGTRTVTRRVGDQGRYQLVLFGPAPAAAVVWSASNESCELALSLGAAAAAQCGTGEGLPRAADGTLRLPLGPWPVVLTGLSDADQAVLETAVTAL